MKKEFKVTGMSCSACQAHVEKAVRKLNVEDCVVNLLLNKMVVVYDETKVDVKEIIQAVKKAGYGAEELVQKNADTSVAGKNEKKDVPVKLIISAVLTVLTLYLSMAHMLKLPFYEFLSANYVVQTCLIFVFVCGVICLNIRYFISGFSKLFKLSPNMDTLIALGSSVSFLYSVYLFFAYVAGGLNGQGPHLYLDASATILTLISLGKYFEGMSKKKTSVAIEKLLNTAPDTAIIWKDGQEVVVKSEEVQVGDILIMKDGMSFPVDGEVVEGIAGVDESLITGESIPVEKSVGEKVVCGTIVVSGYLKIKATQIGKDTTLAKIVKLVEQANETKAPVAKLADKVAGIFVPIVMGIAIVVFVIWLIVGADVGTALNYGVSVLVVSCPCALGLATPVAIMVGTGKGAENGILIKSGEALQALSGVKTVAFDKTGTLTAGYPVVTDIVEFGEKTEFFMPIVYAAEELSSHPLAKAVCCWCEEKSVSKAKISEFSSENGRGISVVSEGVTYYVGSGRYLSEHGLNLSSDLEKTEKYAAEGKTPVYVFSDKVLGMICLRDELKPTARAAVEKLTELGVRSVMITGDNKAAAKAIAKAAGIETVYAEVLPDGKEQVVKELKGLGGAVGFVGDGVNDAPALNSADVGLAIGAGSDIAVESADIVLTKDDVFDVANAIALSKRMMRTIRQNLFWAFFYNMLCIPVAAGVLSFIGVSLNPMFCALAMSLSSLFVVGNALRLKTFKVNKSFARCTNSSCSIVKPEKAEDLKKGDCLKSSEIIIDKEKNLNKKEDNNMEFELKVEGMMCSHCEKAVSSALKKVDGVIDVVADHVSGLVKVTALENVSEEAMKIAVEDKDYKVLVITRK